jgi:hypothetical protein
MRDRGQLVSLRCIPRLDWRGPRRGWSEPTTDRASAAEASVQSGEGGRSYLEA